MKNLLKLQRLDLKIEAFRRREKEIPKQKEKFDIHKKRLAEELKQSEERCKNLILEQRECELDISAKQEQIGKYEQQLLVVKKNDEYSALLHEIETQKKQITQREERIIGILLEIDEAKEINEEDGKRIAEEQEGIEQQCRCIDQELAEAVKERQALESAREPILSAIDRSLLSQYNRIRKAKKGGAAVVPLNNETCSGCYMHVTPQIVNEILGGEKVHACAHCGRILYNQDLFLDTAAEIVEGE